MDITTNLPQLEDNLTTLFNDVSINFGSAVTSVGPLLLWVLGIIGYWLCLKKLGDGGWKSIIPIYSTYTMFKHAFKSVIWFILYFLGNIAVYVSVIGLVFSLIGVFASAITTNGDFDESSTIILVVSLLVFCIVGLFVSILNKVAIFKFMAKIDGSYVASIIGIFIPQIVLFFLGVVPFDFNKVNEQRKNLYDNNGYMRMDDPNNNTYDYYGGGFNDKQN